MNSLKHITVNYAARSLRVLLTGIVIMLLLPAQAQPSREYSLKAVFLYNFTRFVEWPPQSFAASGDPFIIGILGTDPFGPVLDEVASGEKVATHPIVVKRFQHVADVDGCHILFVGNNEAVRVNEVLASLQSRNTLTVSDIPGFAASGGIIGFTTRESKIKLQVNLAASKASDLNISSKLLQVAEIVK